MGRPARGGDISQPNMVASHIKNGIRDLRRGALLRDGAGLTDGQLLERYLVGRDAAALAGLIRRHGGMVWGVCRRLLHDFHDAEDAFQATFLVLVRRAASVTPPELVGNWLHGVAYQTALKARAAAAKRRSREKQVTPMPEPEAPETTRWSELQPLLDRELSRLPARQRAAIVLCDLEGQTRRQAARQLGVPEGTVAGWLARARTTLAKRLARHGPALSGGALAALMAQSAAAGAPGAVLASTLKVASLVAAQPAAAGVVSASVAALTDGVMKTMLLKKLKAAATLLLAAALLIAGRPVYNALASPSPPAARQEQDAAPPEKAAGKSDNPGAALAGRWLMTLPAGFRYVVSLRPLGENRFALENAVRFSGIYELRDKRLVLVGPLSKVDAGIVWELVRPEELTLISQPKTGDYLGAALRRLPEPGASGPGGEWGAAAAGLRSLVETADEQLRFTPGAPVAIVCRTKNFGKETVLVHHGRRQPYRVKVIGPQGKPVPHTPLGVQEFLGREGDVAIKLSPGAEITESYQLDRLFDMTQLGRYKVSFHLDVRVDGEERPLTVNSPVLMMGIWNAPAADRNRGEKPVSGERQPKPGPAPVRQPAALVRAEPLEFAAADDLGARQERDAARALERIKAEYRLYKEPAYQAPVQYCLLLLGRQSPVRMWLASDGVKLYVDRNSNGDLTDRGEAIPFKAEGFAAFFADPLAGGHGAPHRHLHIAVRQRDWQNNKGGYWSVRGDVEGRYPMYAFSHKFAKKPEDAPVIHLGGPMRMGLYELQGGSLSAGRAADLAAYVVCAYPGTEKAFIDVDERCPKDIHPLAEVVLPAKTPGTEPITLRVPLRQRC